MIEKNTKVKDNSAVDSAEQSLPVAPILLLTATVVLCYVAALSSKEIDKKDDDIIDIIPDPPIVTFLDNINSSSLVIRSSFYKNVRSLMNSSSIHGIDQLLSLSIIPLLTSTISVALKLINRGQINTLDDIRTYVYMNIYLKCQHDFSTNPISTQDMMGHYASIFGSGNLGNLANVDTITTEFDKDIPYESSFMSREINPFVLDVSNPLFENTASGPQLATNIAIFGPDKALFKDNGITRIKIPRLVDDNNISLFSDTTSRLLIMDLLTSDPSEYIEGYFKNLVESPLWLDSALYYKVAVNPISVKDDSSFMFSVREGILPVTWDDFADKMANTNMIPTLPSATFQQIFDFLSHNESLHSALELSRSIDGEVFGHSINLAYPLNSLISGNVSSAFNTDTNRNFNQLLFSIVDDILIKGLTNSITSNDNFVPLLFRSNSIISDFRTTKWNKPLFTALRYQYVYYPPLPEGDGIFL